MGFMSLYKNLRKKSESESLLNKGVRVFQDEVKKSLIKEIPHDKDDEITVVWASDDTTESSRAIQADYSIELEVAGIDVAGSGTATLNNSNVFNAILKFYITQEVGTENDYITTINAGGYSEDKFVADLTSKVSKMFDKVRPKKEED